MVCLRELDECESRIATWFVSGVRQLDQKSLDYFRRREQAERCAAKSASSGEARRAHQELALRYGELVRNGEGLEGAGESVGNNALEIFSRREARL